MNRLAPGGCSLLLAPVAQHPALLGHVGPWSRVLWTEEWVVSGLLPDNTGVWPLLSGVFLVQMISYVLEDTMSENDF